MITAVLKRNAITLQFAMLLIVSLISCSVSHHPHNDAYDEYGLKGKVKTFKAGNTPFCVFDENGNLLYIRSSRRLSNSGLPDTVELYETFFKYNDRGDLILEEGDFIFKQKKIRIYDDKGRMLEERFTGGRHVNKDSVYVFRYDNAGTRTEYIKHGPDEKLFEITKYDKNGNVIEFTHYLRDGIIARSERSAYNRRNQLTEKVYSYGKDDDRNRKGKETCQYDAKENLTAHEVYSLKGILLERTINKYSANKPSESHNISYDTTGKVEQTLVTTYKYNSLGQLVEKKEEHQTGISHNSTATYIYSDYDAYGNYLAEEFIYENWFNNQLDNRQTGKHQREIEYYK